ncbi:TetR family transcriptional regulator [Hephaestia caeni]|uniref:TetR family transcriptional regulator n=1 Tax=Hephaestia caeni TaxID=645617 RepID=A0A397PLK7_9SPHN|nr:CerR family C-terminal domain-containing protein [Hephaestia caeni]RIA47004.1 TetR family transcriptional regulator [Hephaestia caeni]
MIQNRLLETAVREFGRKGLDGASTRGIAKAAGTAMSSITYHYGGKEGLYLAAADYIVSQMDDGVSIEGGSRPKTPDEARLAIHKAFAGFIDKLAGPRSEAWAPFIVREQMNPTAAFDRLWAGPMGRNLGTLVTLVRIATGAPDDAAARLAVVTLFGQVIVIRAARAMCGRLLGGPLDDPDFIPSFKARIAANTDAVLDRLISEQGQS